MPTVALAAAFASLVPHGWQLSRRAAVSGAVLSVGWPHHAAAADTPPSVPASAILLRLVDTTAKMETTMQRAADDLEVGPPITREENSYSVNVLLQSSRLDTIPNAGEAADTLRGVKAITGTATSEITRDEFVSLARQYALARDELEKTFAALSEDQQEEARRVVRKMQAALDERKQALAEEKEKLRVARARLAEEDQQRAAEPRRKKTLAELEAAQASMFDGQPQAVRSLYAQ